MRTIVFAAALALGPVVLLTGPAAAAPAARTPTEARVEILLGRLVAYSQPHQATLIRSTEVMNAAVVGVDRAIGMYEAGSSDGSWFPAWEQDVRARAAAMRAEIAALPSFPRETAAELMAGSPGADRRIQSFERVGKDSRALALANVEFAEQLIPMVRLVALENPDAAALETLSMKLTAAARLSINATMTLLEASVSATEPDHPQTALSLAMLGNYRPIDRFLAYNEATLKGQTPDKWALAADIRADIADVRREVARLIANARKARGELPKIADVTLRNNLSRAVGTYDESAAVELKIAGRIETVAAAIDGGADPLEMITNVLGDIEPLELERAAIQSRRLAALAR
jgi:hypothetical protein